MTFNRRDFLFGLASPALASLPLFDPAHAQTQILASLAEQLITAARTQIGVTINYDGSYRALAYPEGDVPRATGVCTDVIIRAYRDAFGVDLQKAVHEDMARHFAAYPKIWGLSRTDRNIDHRRVPNLETFFARQNAARELPTDLELLEAGDLLTMRLPRNLPHIAIVTGKATRAGMPYIIHNIGAGTREEPLTRYGLDTLLERRFRYLDI